MQKKVKKNSTGWLQDTLSIFLAEKDGEKENLKVNPIWMNILVVLLYLITSLIPLASGFFFLHEVTSLFYLVILTPLNLLSVTKVKMRSTFERIAAIFVVFFFVYIPILLIANINDAYEINKSSTLWVNLIISGSAILVFLFSKSLFLPIQLRDLRKHVSGRSFLEYIKNHKVIILIFLLYSTIHIINFKFYYLIPELDGYKYMVDIRECIAQSKVIRIQRSGFLLSNSIIEIFTGVTTYRLFSFWYIGLEFIFFGVLYQFVKIFNIRRISTQFLILFSALCIPVMNIEFDLIRPQTMFITFMPVYVYFLYQALRLKTIKYWFFSSLIAITGFIYHEFMFSILVVHSIMLIAILMRFSQRILTTKKFKSKDIILIFGSFFLMSICIFFLNKYLNLYDLFDKRFQLIYEAVGDKSKWTWWFIDSYDYGEGELTYPGINGMARFYGYYISPVIFMVIGLYVYNLIRRRKIKSKNQDNLILILSMFILIFIFFAEGLPRLGYLYIPERFWVFFNLSWILILVTISASHHVQNLFQKRGFQAFCLSLCFLGLSGSFYISSSKKSLTRPAEHKTTIWIKDNIEENALFYSQNGNMYMIKYFAERDFWEPSELYFMGDRVWEGKTNRPTYLLYSEQKFNDIYKNLDFWKERNYYGANLEKFDEAYEKIYDQDNVYIWRIWPK